MSTMATAIFWCAIQVTALSAVALLIHTVVRRVWPAMAVVVSAVSMPMILLLTIAMALPIPSFTAEATRHWLSNDAKQVDVAHVREEGTDEGTDEGMRPVVREAKPAESEASAIPSWLETAVVAIQFELSQPAPTATTARRDWRPYAVFSVACLGALGLFRVLWGLATCTSLRKRGKPIESSELLAMLDALTLDLGLPRRVEVMESDSVSSPATLGWWRPVVLLPAGTWRDWSYDQLQVVLAHELAHIRRGDFALGLIGHVCVALHFYHPLVHWLAARMRLDQELNADNAAAELNGGPHRYLEILARMVLDHDSRLVGWPAPMFIPTRGTLVRRIEMLKSNTSFSRRGRTAQVMLTVSLVAVALICAGIRTPLSPLASDNRAAAQDQGGANSAVNTSYVASDADAVVVLRPQRILNHAVLGKLATIFSESNPNFNILQDKNLAQLTWVYRSSTELGRGGQFPLAPITTIIEMKEKSNFATIKSLLKQQADEAVIAKIVGPDGPNALCSYQRDEKTLIVDSRKNLTVYLAAMATDAPELLQGANWKAIAASDMAVAVDGEVLTKMIAQPNSPIAPLVGPALDGCQTIHLGITGKKTPELQASFTGRDAETAAKIESTLTTLKLLGISGLENVRKAPVREGEEFERVFVDMGIRTLKSAELATIDNVVSLNMNTPLDTAEQAAAMAEAVRSARRSARSMQSMNNVKQIMLALHNYHSAYGHFPASKVLGPDGKHYHSWRVAILPFIEQQALYNAYKLDEPWDSKDNKKIGETVVQVYVDPESKGQHHHSNYYFVVGEGTGFTKEASAKGSAIKDIRDGTSNTILVVSAQRGIPWTKPEDLSLDSVLSSYQDGKVKLGVDGRKFYAGFADGSAKPFPLTIEADELKDFVLINNRK